MEGGSGTKEVSTMGGGSGTKGVGTQGGRASAEGSIGRAVKGSPKEASPLFPVLATSSEGESIARPSATDAVT